jgi:very-short-patch-repair endonuclease
LSGQQPIGGFLVDCYCHQAALVVEVDGDVHDTRAEADAQRDRHLRGRGFRVLRVRNEDVRSALGAVLEAIAAACRGE